MRIRVVREPEVADVRGAVLSLRERAQQHRLQQREVGTVADAVDQRGVVHRGRLVAAGQREPGAGEEFAQHREFLGRRPLVHPVERGLLVPGEELRRAHVRGQHAFLDQPVRVVARRRNDARDLALVVELQRELDGIEVDGAAPFARGEQHLVERVELRQVRQQRARVRG